MIAIVHNTIASDNLLRRATYLAITMYEVENDETAPYAFGK